jgi:phosphate transport system ATP-binding protein
MSDPTRASTLLRDNIGDPTMTQASNSETAAAIRAEVRDLKFWYGKFQALNGVTMPIYDRKVTAIIGPSGCGKSTLLRCFNRIHDLYPGIRYEGEINLAPENVNLVERGIDPILVRLLVGMVFQKPNPFPKSIFENVAAGLYVRGIRNKAEVEGRVEEALRQAAIWNEVKDRLSKPAYELSGGQQQRLCIARALAPKPKLLLLDEPTSALDPIATAKIEELMDSLVKDVTILIVTHNLAQAARISKHTAFMHMGNLIEFGETEQMFTNPTVTQTQDYVTGRFG